MVFQLYGICPFKTSTRNRAGVRDPHANSGHRRDPRSIIVGEAKLNNIVHFVYTVCAVQLINTWRQAVEVSLPILKIEDTHRNTQRGSYRVGPILRMSGSRTGYMTFSAEKYSFFISLHLQHC